MPNDGTIVSGDRRIASTQNGGIYDMANARLIAKAPELVEALRNLLDVAHGLHFPAANAARALLAEIEED
jgi:hypothetical protein